MQVLGRILARGDIKGVYAPFSSSTEKLDGIYEIREILGELTIVRIGDSSHPHVSSLDLQGVHLRPDCFLTPSEMGQIAKGST